MTDSITHEIVVVPAAGEPGHEELLQKCFDIRSDVFHREQGFPLEVEFDDLDATATHFLLRLTPSLQPVGTIRAWKGKDYYQLGRLAVLSEWRKHHFGRELVLALHDWIKRDAMVSGTTGTVRIQCHSQLYAKPFYAKFGYIPEGDEFRYPGDYEPQQLMKEVVVKSTGAVRDLIAGGHEPRCEEPELVRAVLGYALTRLEHLLDEAVHPHRGSGDFT